MFGVQRTKAMVEPLASLQHVTSAVPNLQPAYWLLLGDKGI